MTHGRITITRGALVTGIALGCWWALDGWNTGVFTPLDAVMIGLISAVLVIGALALRAVGQRVGTEHRSGAQPATQVRVLDWMPHTRSFVSALSGAVLVLTTGLVLLLVGFAPAAALLDPITGSRALDFAIGHVAQFAFGFGALMLLPVPGTDVGSAFVGLTRDAWSTRVLRVAINGVAVASVFAAVVVVIPDDAWDWLAIPAMILVASIAWWRTAVTTIDLTVVEPAITSVPRADVHTG